MLPGYNQDWTYYPLRARHITGLRLTFHLHKAGSRGKEMAIQDADNRRWVVRAENVPEDMPVMELRKIMRLIGYEWAAARARQARFKRV